MQVNNCCLFVEVCLKIVLVLGIPEQKWAVTSRVASAGLLGSSCKSLASSLSVLDTEVLILIVYVACDGRVVECKHT